MSEALPLQMRPEKAKISLFNTNGRSYVRHLPDHSQYGRNTSMPYLTRGTIQLIDGGGATNDFIRITPVEDYAVKHLEKCYIALIEMSDGKEEPNGSVVIVCQNYKFSLAANTLKDSLRIAAFERVVIELTIDAEKPPSDKFRVTALTVPVTPPAHAR